ESLLAGKLDIDLLMVLAAIAAALVGAPRDGAILLCLFSLAGTLESYALGNTKKAVVSLMKIRPDEANRLSLSGEITVVPVEDLVIGDVVVIRPGERVPIDGKISLGESSIDQSSITGESVPVDKMIGDTVFAGTVNGHGVLQVEVTQTASHSTLARMITLVTEAQAKRSPSERFSDWFGERYTLVVLVGSTLGLIGFLVVGFPLADALYKAATLLVVASPCAIVISVPAAILSALAASARQGMLFKGGAALETFAHIDTIAFDKTGTLTTGKMQVMAMEAVSVEEAELMRIALALEVHSEHPLAHSVVTYVREHNTSELAVTNARAVPGKGIVATIDGRTYGAGNRALLRSMNVSIDKATEARIEAYETEGYTTILVASDTLLGIFAIADSVRATAKETVAALHASGITRIVMVTGDNIRAAHHIARAVGIDEKDVYAELLPEDKVRVVEELKSVGRVAFVGDGVNDAAALVTAQIGIAMGTAGSDVALEAADVALLSDDLQKIVAARKLSQKTNSIIKQNLIFALGILVIMVIVTTFFYLPLPLGVIGHEGGTLLVVLNGLRLLLK
ncbi:MAG: cation-translocating P-type ATPase, partial [Patescibacteria group bacterium]